MNPIDVIYEVFVVYFSRIFSDMIIFYSLMAIVVISVLIVLSISGIMVRIYHK